MAALLAERDAQARIDAAERATDRAVAEQERAVAAFFVARFPAPRSRCNGGGGGGSMALWALVPPLLLFPALLMRKKDLEMRARVRA